MSSSDCEEYWRPYQAQRSYLFQLWGLETGNIKGCIKSRMLSVRRLNKAADAGEVRTLRQEQRQLSKVYDMGKNQLHVATLISCEPVVGRRVRMTCVLSAHLRLAHGLQAKGSRSPPTIRAYYCQQAQGRWLDPLRKGFGDLQDPEDFDSAVKRTPENEFWMLAVVLHTT